MLFTKYTTDFLRMMNPVFEEAKKSDDEMIRDLQLDTLKAVLVRFDQSQREMVRNERERT